MNLLEVRALTLDQLLRLKAEVDEAERQLAQNRAVVNAAIQELVAGLGLTAPVPQTPAAEATPQPSPIWRKPTWGSVVPEIIKRADRGLTPDDVLQTVKETGVYPLLVGLKGMYNVLYRMTKDKEVVFVHGYYYSRELYNKMKAAGRSFPKRVRVRRPPMRKFIFDALATHPEGLTGDQLADEMRAIPNSPSAIKSYRGYIFKVLEPLLARGQLVKDGERYRLPEKAKGKTSSERPAPQVQLWSGEDATRRH